MARQDSWLSFAIKGGAYMKVVPDQLGPWLGSRLLLLGTDGFGRSDNREYLRRHF